MTSIEDSANSTASSRRSESSADLDMAEDSFSQSTRAEIHAVCRNRCVICMKGLGALGKRRIIDSEKEGDMVTYATKVGVLDANYDQSGVANGIILCSSCHQDFLRSNLLVLSPPRQILQYLVDYIKMGGRTPIYELLNQLLLPDSHTALPDPQHALPFLGLYSLVALAPGVLESVDFHIYEEFDVSQLLNGHWAIVPPDSTQKSLASARIYDATTILPSNDCLGFTLELSSTSQQEQRYWRLPTTIAAILTRLLHSVAHLLDSDSEEIRLAIELRCLLDLRYISLIPVSTAGV